MSIFLFHALAHFLISISNMYSRTVTQFFLSFILSSFLLTPVSSGVRLIMWSTIRSTVLTSNVCCLSHIYPCILYILSYTDIRTCTRTFSLSLLFISCSPASLILLRLPLPFSIPVLFHSLWLSYYENLLYRHCSMNYRMIEEFLAELLSSLSY